MGRVDIITGTLGKALGGASGGYTSGRREIVELLRQRSRPYLFSNSLAPPIVGRVARRCWTCSTASTTLRDTLRAEHRALPRRHDRPGLRHPARRRTRSCPSCSATPRAPPRVAERLLSKGVYVMAFSYPVVPQGKARIRTQVSAAHSPADLEFAIRMFREVRQELAFP